MSSSEEVLNCSRIKIGPSKELLEIISKNHDYIDAVPENIAKACKQFGYALPTKIQIINDEIDYKDQIKINSKLLYELTKSVADVPEDRDSSRRTKRDRDYVPKEKTELKTFLRLSDIRWCNNFLTRLRKEKVVSVFLHDFLESCSLELPKDPEKPRNPEYEERCRRLREIQQDMEYRSMTKNVDSRLKNFPEDTIAYQMKAINRQCIAVLQYVFSVIAGFAFGFIGIELIIGDLDFGLRLMLGVMFALIIAIAEIYFLAKKLNEYDDVVASSKKFQNEATTAVKNKKPHSD